MTQTSFSKDWTFRVPVGTYAAGARSQQTPQAVTQPHDAMLGLERSAARGSGSVL